MPPRNLPQDALDDASTGDAPTPFPRDNAILRYRDQRIVLSGRALHHILWLAAHHTAINSVASQSGQIWLTWKGGSIAGEIRTRL